MNKIDFGFISKLEGGRRLDGYVPAASSSKSGVTVATGFDLGAREAKDLQALKLPAALVEKLVPYLGKQSGAAKSYLGKNPLRITAPEADLIDHASKGSAADRLSVHYDKAVRVNGGHLSFEELLPEAQTVIASVAFQYGDLATRTPKFWKAVTSQDFRAAVGELRDFGDAYAPRRAAEANLLDLGLSRSNAAPQPKVGPSLTFPHLFEAILGTLASWISPAAPTAKAASSKTAVPTAKAASSKTAVAPSAAPSERCFPFATVTKQSWEQGSRAFGSNREGGARAHGGCDLYYPVGTLIYAVADGKVIRGPYPFYCETYALEVDHGAFVIRYGEIGSALVKEGDTVKVGQKIAKVGHLVGITVPSDMLHLEMFAGSAKGSLSVSGATSAKRKDGVPFKRRSDLIDPTPFLNAWKKTLPRP